MAIFTRDKKFYGQLLTIAVPIALQNLINFSVSMADTVMVGLLGEVPLAAANLANKFGMIFMLFTFGLGSGCNVMMAQFWGKKDTDSIHKIMTIMYRFLFVGGVFFSVLAIFFPMQIMAFFTPELETQLAGADYLRIIGFSYLLTGFSSVSLSVLRSVSSVKIAVFVYLCSLGTNVFLNWVLIFGKLGAPALGIQGAAIATVIARVVEVVITVIYFLRVENKILYRFRYLFNKNLGFVKDFFKTAGPVIVNEIIWGLGSALISAIIGHRGTAFTAADSVTGVLSQLVTITIWGVGHATAAIIGNTVGAGEYKKAKEYAKSMMVLSVILGLVSCGLVLLLRDPMVSLFDITPLAQTYSRQLINVYSVVVIFQSISAICLIGILRGGGDTRFVLLMDLVFMWTISIPLGFVASAKLVLPVWIVYAVIRSDELFKTAFAMGRIIRGTWVKDVTQRGPVTPAEEAAIEEEERHEILGE